VNLLAIDAASSVLSVAVCRGDDVRHIEAQAGMKHSELVMSLIDEQMKLLSLNAGDLDGVLCMGGPGSFTGLRIGYSIAKGLALSLSIPFAPVPTLDCIAFACRRDSGLLVPLIEARKNAYFWTVFRGGQRLVPDADAPTGEIADAVNKYLQNEKVILAGPGAQGLFDALTEDVKQNVVLDEKKFGYADELIAIAKTKNIFHNDNTAFLYSGPEYIRKTDAELSLLEKVGS